MATQKDWLPSSRQEQLTMAKNWLSTLQSGTINAWGVPPAIVTGFADIVSEAEMALMAAKNEETRTPAVNARCKTAFEALSAKMRGIKKRYFFEPPTANSGDQRGSSSTKRRKDIIDFEFGDSGKSAYFAVQVENGKKKWPWGSMVQAVIP